MVTKILDFGEDDSEREGEVKGWREEEFGEREKLSA